MPYPDSLRPLRLGGE